MDVLFELHVRWRRGFAFGRWPEAAPPDHACFDRQITEKKMCDPKNVCDGRGENTNRSNTRIGVTCWGRSYEACGFAVP